MKRERDQADQNTCPWKLTVSTMSYQVSKGLRPISILERVISRARYRSSSEGKEGTESFLEEGKPDHSFSFFTEVFTLSDITEGRVKIDMKKNNTRKQEI
jgi:hypothetical protein